VKTFRECYEAVTGLPVGQPGKSHIKINPARHGDTTVNMSVGSGYRVTKDGHEPKHTSTRMLPPSRCSGVGSTSTA
jgi:hypothetical protein